MSLFLISPQMTSVMALGLPVMIGIGSLMGSGLRVLSRRAQEQVGGGNSGNVYCVVCYCFISSTMYVCIRIHTHMHAHTHAHTHTHTHMHAHTHAHTHTHTCTRTRAHANTHACARTYMQVFCSHTNYTLLQICLWVDKQVLATHTHTHTHTHMYRFFY